MPRLHVVRVFVGEDGLGGNPLGVFLEGSEVRPSRRQEVAAELGFSETVFVDDPGGGSLRMFTPASEIEFAGHPLVGCGWLLARERAPVEVLRPPAGEVGVRYEEGLTWIEALPEWSPQREVVQLGRSDEVDALSPEDCSGFDLYAWAWIDDSAGLVRARYFAPGFGIAEDEATGSAAVLLGGRLRRPLTIRQGTGSTLYVLPVEGGRVAVGGRVELVGIREFVLATND